MQERITIRPAEAEAFCLVQITDTHIAREPGPQFDGCDTAVTLAAVLADIRARPRRPDLVFLTGDLVDIPSLEAYGKLRRLLDGLDLPVCCLPGNHDDPDLLRATMQRGRISTPGIVDAGNWRLVLLNDWIPESSGGALAVRELRRLESELEDAGERPVLIAVHHPPVPIGSPWMDAMGMENPADLFGVIDRFTNARALICGHIHQEYEALRRDVQLLGTPSTCVQFSPGATEYQVDAKPPGYRELLLRPDGRFTTRVIRVPVA